MSAHRVLVHRLSAADGCSLCKRPVGGVLPPAGHFLFASCARAIPLVAGHCDARGACCLVV